VTRTCLLCLAFLLIACGGDIGEGDDEGGSADASSSGSADAAAAADAALGCGETGGGAVTSATAGTEVEPVVSAWYQIVDTDASALVIDERASNCDPDAISDQPGQLVSIYFCSALEVGEYQALPALAGACPGERQASVTVVNELYQDLVNDTTGSLTIEAVGDCIIGSFTTTTPDDLELSGSFRAYPCP
jgi:hypothetical protein